MVPITPVQYRISTQHGRPPDLGQITPNTAFKTHILVFQKPNTAFKTRIEKSQIVMTADLINMYFMNKGQWVHDNNIMGDFYVPVLDTVGDANYHLVKVVSITETCTKLHYLVTKSTQPLIAVRRYLFHQVRRGRPRVRTSQPKSRDIPHACQYTVICVTTYGRHRYATHGWKPSGLTQLRVQWSHTEKQRIDPVAKRVPP